MTKKDLSADDLSLFPRLQEIQDAIHDIQCTKCLQTGKFVRKGRAVTSTGKIAIQWKCNAKIDPIKYCGKTAVYNSMIKMMTTKVKRTISDTIAVEEKENLTFGIHCPACNTYISEKHLLTVGAICPNISVTEYKYLPNRPPCKISAEVLVDMLVYRYGHVNCLYNKTRSLLSEALLVVSVNNQDKKKQNKALINNMPEPPHVFFRLSENTLVSMFKPYENMVREKNNNNYNNFVRLKGSKTKNLEITPTTVASMYIDEEYENENSNEQGDLLFSTVDIKKYIEEQEMCMVNDKCICNIPCIAKLRFNALSYRKPWDKIQNVDRQIVKDYEAMCMRNNNNEECTNLEIDNLKKVISRNEDVACTTKSNYMETCKWIDKYRLLRQDTNMMSNFKQIYHTQGVEKTKAILDRLLILLKQFTNQEVEKIFGITNWIVRVQIANKYHRKLKEEIAQKVKQQKASLSQLANWASVEEIQNMVKVLETKKEESIWDLQKYIAWALMIQISPRNALATLKITEYNQEKDNFIRDNQLVFNFWKNNRKGENSYVFNVQNEKLKTDIQRLIQHRNEKKHIYLFMNIVDKPLYDEIKETTAAFTSMMINTSRKHLGKNIGSAMWRTIKTTTDRKNEKTISEKELENKQMFHGQKIAETTYTKIGDRDILF